MKVILNNFFNSLSKTNVVTVSYFICRIYNMNNKSLEYLSEHNVGPSLLGYVLYFLFSFIFTSYLFDRLPT